MTKAQGARLRVFLKPGASASRVVGWSGNELVISVRERPIDGRANDGLVSLLAEALDIPRGSLGIVGGATSRHKTIEVAGRSQEWLDEQLSRTVDRIISPAPRGDD